LNKPVVIWTPVWIIAAQSIWEPGTQLTMRTFHSWWVAKEGWDMTQGLSRVEELLESRAPKMEAEISDIDWIVSIENTSSGILVKVEAEELITDEYYFDEYYDVAVKVWAEVKKKQIIARSNKDKSKIISNFAWVVSKIEEGIITVSDKTPRVFEYNFPVGKNIIPKDGDKIKVWEKITSWSINLQKLKDVAWVLPTEQYIVDDIKAIYSSQGQTVNSKHIELVVRQMFSRVRITSKWDSEFFPGDIVDIIKFKKTNDSLISEGKKPSIAERLLLGITKISLHTDSWLSAASFQETVRVLVEGSVSGKIDKFQEMKENVIIGRQIPAWKQYRKVNKISLEWEYFDEFDEWVDIWEEHMWEVMKQMEHESDF
jgi:DNA-directed RNA polymerase subunit beta'